MQVVYWENGMSLFREKFLIPCMLSLLLALEIVLHIWSIHLLIVILIIYVIINLLDGLLVSIIVYYYLFRLLSQRSNEMFLFFLFLTAKAIYDNKLLECYFTRSFYKHILGILVKHTDMESEDYSFYKGLVYLTEHTIADLGYELTFSTEVNKLIFHISFYKLK